MLSMYNVIAEKKISKQYVFKISTSDSCKKLRKLYFRLIFTKNVCQSTRIRAKAVHQDRKLSVALNGPKEWVYRTHSVSDQLIILRL